MNIAITGSLGHIGQPLSKLLVENGHNLTVISSDPEKVASIEILGATAAIGSVHDKAFLSKTFAGADAVFTMVPPVSYYDPDLDPVKHFSTLGNTYKAAILNGGVKHVVNLSSWGAHRDNGTGGIVGTFHLENTLNDLPADVSITHIRPTSFYYNLFGFIPSIKYTGRIAANYGGDDLTVLVSPVDIASAVSEEILKRSVGRNIRYVASEEISCHEVARILGEAIGLPELKWDLISGEEMLETLTKAGLPKRSAELLVELQAGHHKGLIGEDYWQNRPEKLGKVKTVNFAEDFAKAYHQK
jgi:uncharacterized protein YbjT (DUF2867 family)